MSIFDKLTKRYPLLVHETIAIEQRLKEILINIDHSLVGLSISPVMKDRAFEIDGFHVGIGPKCFEMGSSFGYDIEVSRYLRELNRHLFAKVKEEESLQEIITFSKDYFDSSPEINFYLKVFDNGLEDLELIYGILRIYL